MGNVVLGVGGSIAAYKACDVASKLVQAGHRVDVLMTRAARRFVRPLSFSALTHRRVVTDRDWGRDALPHDHLRFVVEADAVVVAPCTANLIGKFANGIADDVLSTSWLAAEGPRVLAPAMNHRMWAHPRVRANVETLAEEGVLLVGPESGWLSEDEVGLGRMSEPADVVAAVERALRV